jgi:hypothetical protein
MIAGSTASGGHYTKVSENYSTNQQQTPSRPTFKQRSASSTQPNLNSHITRNHADPSPVSAVPGSSSSTSFFSMPTPLSASINSSTGYAGFANLPAAGESSTSITSPPNPAFHHSERPSMPTKKGSFANLKNVFKAATSGKSSAAASSSSSGAGVGTGSGISSPGAHNTNNYPGNGHMNGNGSGPSTPTSAQTAVGNTYPALRNPFSRSFSSNALPGTAPASAGVHPSGMSLRSVERTGSTSTSGTGAGGSLGPQSGKTSMGGKMYRVKDRPVAQTQYQPVTSSRKLGMSNSSNRQPIQQHQQQRSHHRAQASITTASSIGSGSVGSRYNSSGVSRVREDVEEESTMTRPPGSAPLYPSKRASHGYSSSDHSLQPHHHPRQADLHNLVHQQPGAESFVIPEPRSPGEIVMHELFRRFVSRSSDKLDLVVGQPLFNAEPGIGFVAPGKDTGYDDLLRSIAGVSKDYPREVMEFISGWGKSHGRSVQLEEREDMMRDPRMREVEAILDERRKVSDGAERPVELNASRLTVRV